MESQHAAHVADFDLGHFGRTDEPHARETVLNCPRFKGPQTHCLISLSRATTSLPHSFNANPRSAQYDLSILAPDWHSFDRSDAGV